MSIMVKLEEIFHCPVCGSRERSLLYKNLKDYLDFESKLEWTLWKCLSCNSGYYNPRPTKDSIHLFYKHYSTHNQSKMRTQYQLLGGMQKIKRRFANSYTNHRYGTADKEVLPLGKYFVNLIPGIRGSLDLAFRFIPRPQLAESRLLDFGCGNGDFLRTADRCGYLCHGVDFDKEAINVGRQYFEHLLCGDIDTIDEGTEFDVITVSHVLEHIFEPNLYLRKFYKFF